MTATDWRLIRLELKDALSVIDSLIERQRLLRERFAILLEELEKDSDHDA
jgi:hypothetical protein